ncbi:MAG TPA: hypothetical protein P5513_01015 [Candidatus Diapherotrites archaeon]|jgi:aspartyl/asparaginyl-tRNA synthetase|nr:hypothetical protein [Candidatus Diapherotrites archaeon]
MKEKQFKVILISLIIACFLVLIGATYFFQPPFVSISELNKNQEKYLGKTITISGTIKEIETKQKIVFITLCQNTYCLPSVLFTPNNAQIETLQKHHITKQKIKFIGQYTLYEETPELIIYKIEEP